MMELRANSKIANFIDVDHKFRAITIEHTEMSKNYNYLRGLYTE
jgi:hypothetical protein